MTGRRHRSNCELIAQGLANIASALFGGLCVTGAIARTATNMRAGARSPVAGILHSLFLLRFMLLAAPLASYIPLAALAAVLVVVSWNMIERDQIATIIKYDSGETVVLFTTAILTVAQDITVGIAAGVTLGSLIFMHRMARIVAVEKQEAILDDDLVDTIEPETPERPRDPDFIVYRISGPFFFGAVSMVAAALDQIGTRPKAFVLDLARVPLADGAAAHALHGFVERSAGAASGFMSAAPRARSGACWSLTASTAASCIFRPTRTRPAIISAPIRSIPRTPISSGQDREPGRGWKAQRPAPPLVGDRPYFGRRACDVASGAS